MAFAGMPPPERSVISHDPSHESGMARASVIAQVHGRPTSSRRMLSDAHFLPGRVEASCDVLPPLPASA